MQRGRSWGVLGALALADAGLLRWLWPYAARAGRLAGQLSQPQQWVGAVGADRAVLGLAGVAAWLVAAWLGVGLAAAFAAHLPGAAGRVARVAGRVLLPRFCYRLVVGTAGLSVLAGPVAAQALAPPPGGPPPATATVSAPHWPSATRPAPRLPVPPARAADTRVTVRPGDSLWRIAASRLPRTVTAARVAAAWPHWYAANRATVGPDPNRLLPGQILDVPEEFR